MIMYIHTFPEVSEAPIAGGDSQSVMNLKNLYTACMDERETILTNEYIQKLWFHVYA